VSEYMTYEVVGSRLPTPKAASTIERWVHRGLMGGTVRLETVAVGGTPCVTPDALERFFQRLTAAKRARRESLTAAPSGI
jgi:hypothetical protein